MASTFYLLLWLKMFWLLRFRNRACRRTSSGPRPVRAVRRSHGCLSASTLADGSRGGIAILVREPLTCLHVAYGVIQSIRIVFLNFVGRFHEPGCSFGARPRHLSFLS